MHPTHVTPPSPYAIGGVEAHLPVAYAGGTALSVVSAGEAAVRERTAAAYAATEKAMQGGTFPIGAGRCWHGGVHLPTGEPPDRATSLVRAMLPGRVVAARLAPPGAVDTTLGSPNFVLVEHDVDALVRPAADESMSSEPSEQASGRKVSGPLFALYMHLGVQEVTDALTTDVPWLRGKPTAFATRRATPFFARPEPTDNRVVARLENGFRFVPVGAVRGYGRYRDADWPVFDLGAVWDDTSPDQAVLPVPFGLDALALEGRSLRALRRHNIGRATPAAAYSRTSSPALRASIDVFAADRLARDGVVGPLVCVHPRHVRPVVGGPSPLSGGTVHEIFGVNAFMPARRVPTGHDDGRRGTLAAGTAVTINHAADAPDGWAAIADTPFDPGYMRADALVPHRWRLAPPVARALADGAIAVFDDPPAVQAGTPLGLIGTLGRAGSADHPPRTLVHVEMFSAGSQSLYRQLADALVEAYEDRAGPDAAALFDWAEAEDPRTDGFSTTLQAVRETVATPAFATAGAMLAGPASTSAGDHLLASTLPSGDRLRRFFARTADAERLRHYACRFVSEWRKQPRAYRLSPPTQYAPLLWWDAVAAALEALPADGYVWHYHPVRLATLLTNRPAPPPPPDVEVDWIEPAAVQVGHPTTVRARLRHAGTLTDAQTQRGVMWRASVLAPDGTIDREIASGRGGATFQVPGVDAATAARSGGLQVTAYPAGGQPEDGATRQFSLSARVPPAGPLLREYAKR